MPGIPFGLEFEVSIAGHNVVEEMVLEVIEGIRLAALLDIKLDNVGDAMELVKLLGDILADIELAVGTDVTDMKDTQLLKIEKLYGA
jgi:hypothetical protein